jgi:hypothetical protein
MNSNDFSEYPGLKGVLKAYPSFFCYNTSTNTVIQEFNSMDPAKIVQQAEKIIPSSKAISMRGYVISSDNRRVSTSRSASQSLEVPVKPRR